MSQGRQGVILWSIAGALLLAAGVVVLVAMRPSVSAPLPEPPAPDVQPSEAQPFEAPPREAPAPDVQPAASPTAPAARAVPGALDPLAAPVGEAPRADEGSAVGVAPPPLMPLVPNAVRALRAVHLAVPIADVLAPAGPGATGPRPSVAEERLDGMEGMVAGQEAQIRRLETALAEAERIGDIDGARLRRGRLAEVRRIHAGLAGQLARMRDGRAASPNPPPAAAPTP